MSVILENIVPPQINTASVDLLIASLKGKERVDLTFWKIRFERFNAEAIELFNLLYRFPAILKLGPDDLTMIGLHINVIRDVWKKSYLCNTIRMGLTEHNRIAERQGHAIIELPIEYELFTTQLTGRMNSLDVAWNKKDKSTIMDYCETCKRAYV